MGIFKRVTQPASTTEVEIDGLAVEVDAERWENERDVVSAEVREAREGLRLPVDEAEGYLDYDELLGDDSNGI